MRTGYISYFRKCITISYSFVDHKSHQILSKTIKNVHIAISFILIHVLKIPILC